MAGASGFWSYVHRDDAAERGRITQLAEDLSAQYELITGESIKIFVDRSDIEWGEEWRGAIDTALSSIAFFIPIITPRYFQSEECRREFNMFARRARQLGVNELVMPVLYVDFPALQADPPPDDLMALAKSYQWENWTKLRFEAIDSPSYRAAVAGMAERLARASFAVERVAVAPGIEADPGVLDDSDDDDSPGFVDRVARAEEAMNEWVDTLGRIQDRIEEVGALTADAGSRVQAGDARGKGFAIRLVVFKQLAVDLDPPAEAIQELSNAFTSQMNDVDSGVRAILEKATQELQETPNPELVARLRDFCDQIRNLARSADEGLGSLQGMVDSIAAVENDSRNLRPVLRKLRRGLTVLVDGRQVTRAWATLADNLELPISEERDGG